MPEQLLNPEKQPAEKPFPWRCPKCRQLTVTRVTMPYRCQRTHDGRVMTVVVPNLAVPRCSNCGEVVFDYVADEQIREAFLAQFGPAEPLKITEAMGEIKSEEFGEVYKFVKLVASGAMALIVGLVLIATGEPQAILAGSGALLAAALIFGFLRWAGKGHTVRAEGEGPAEAKSPAWGVWLGIGLTLLPGLLYFYLRYSLDRFDPVAMAFVSVPLVIAGLGCVGVSLWSATKG
jgi:hypothetical protein